MSVLPNNKIFMPGFTRIADDAGFVIENRNNIRLGPEFVLTDNTADPSASISVAAAIATAATAAQAASQPLDADLTAIAALSTTAYGRAFLALANQAALLALLPNSGTAAGRIGVPVLIDEQVLSNVASYASPGWSADLYRSIEIDIIGTSGASIIDMVLRSVAGGYTCRAVDGAYLYTSATGVGFTSLAAPYGFTGKWLIKSGMARTFMGMADLTNSGFEPQVGGRSTTTSGGATGLDIAFTGANFNGLVRVSGIPA
jgi:hypothetical protein